MPPWMPLTQRCHYLRCVVDYAYWFGIVWEYRDDPNYTVISITPELVTTETLVANQWLCKTWGRNSRTWGWESDIGKRLRLKFQTKDWQKLCLFSIISVIRKLLWGFWRWWPFWIPACDIWSLNVLDTVGAGPGWQFGVWTQSPTKFWEGRKSRDV